MTRVELIATGDELLNGVIVDTNSPWLMERLAARGLPVDRKTMVRDDRVAIVEALRTASLRSDLVVVSGGLGPTADDITAACAAEAAGVALVLHGPTLDALTVRLSKRGLAVGENNRHQAMVPAGAQVISNRHGTAPMFELTLGQGRFFFLPGVPREFMGLCEEELFPRIADLAAHAPLRRVRYLHCFGIAESALDRALMEIPGEMSGVTLSYRTALPENHVGITVTGRDGAEVDEKLQRATSLARERIGPACFGVDGQTFPDAIASLLRRARATIATAESLTAGLCAAMLADPPGASDYLKGALVAYTDTAKIGALGVRPDLLADHRSVSEAVALDMARRTRQIFGADYAVACTGLAGPAGDGSPEPVGTVFTALIGPSGEQAQRHSFGFERDRNRRFAAYAALDALRRRLL
jgi:nicotinamide-nucleotide amidase